MNNMYAKHCAFISLTALSLVVGLVFFATNHIDFIIKALELNKFNFPNTCFTILRIIGTIILPAIFVVPSMFEFGRIRLAKIAFILTGLLYLLTLTWIIPFILQGNLSRSAFVVFQKATSHQYISSYVFWDTYSVVGAGCSFLYGLLLIITGINLDDNRNKVRTLLIITALFKIFAPIIHNVVNNQRIFSMFWLSNNYLPIISYCLLILAIFIVSFSDDSWIMYIWDQDAPQITPEDE